MKIVSLKKRNEFHAAARFRRWRGQCLTLHAGKRATDSVETVGVGLTCSKKVGGAVVRNRAKRRLREVARVQLPKFGKCGWDYVLIGIPRETVEQGFSQLLRDMELALQHVHRGNRKYKRQ